MHGYSCIGVRSELGGRRELEIVRLANHLSKIARQQLPTEGDESFCVVIQTH